MGCNDEVVMIDIMNDCGTAYQKKKSERAAQKITEKLTLYGNTAFNIQREVNSTLVILNHTIMEFPNVLNIFVDDEFFCEKSKIEDAVREKYIDAFFTEFVRFIQENINETRRKIQKMKYENSDNKKLESIVIAWEIFTWFCDSEGFEVRLSIGKSLKKTEKLMLISLELVASMMMNIYTCPQKFLIECLGRMDICRRNLKFYHC